MADPQDPYAEIAKPDQSDPYAEIAKEPEQESWLHKTFAPRPALAAPGAKPFHADSELPGSSEGANMTEGLADWTKEGPGRMGAGVMDVGRGNFAKGGHEILSGAGTTMTPMAPFMAVGAPALTARMMVGGYLGGKAAGAGAEALGATPDQADLASDAGNIIGGGVAGFGHKMLPNAGHAGQLLESVKQKAGNVPVDTMELQRIVGNALEQKARGGGPLPPPMKMFVKRMNDPTMPPVTYGELRDFASNSGRLSAKANRAMSPTMKKYLGDFAGGANEANRQAAASVGQEEPYSQGMNEYRRAMKIRNAGNAVKKTAIGMAVPGALGYGGYKLYQELNKR